MAVLIKIIKFENPKLASQLVWPVGYDQSWGEVEKMDRKMFKNSVWYLLNIYNNIRYEWIIYNASNT
jgi:hypothetical protein